MSLNWILQTHGDPLTRIRRFIRELFTAAKLDGMLVPVCLPEAPWVEPRLVRDAELLEATGLFAPVTELRAARLASQLYRDAPGENLGMVMRPCELRALEGLSQGGFLRRDHFLTVGVDCIGAFSAEDCEWRGSLEQLTRETLQFARQGGVVMYRYRPACQMCMVLLPDMADLIIGVLGLPTRQFVLVSTSDGALAERLHIREITDGEAPPAVLTSRRRIHSILVERRGRTRKRYIDTLPDALPSSVDDLVTHLTACAPCRKCLEACVLYMDDEISVKGLSNWLSACIGCGACEEVCPKELPLTATFVRVREQLVSDTIPILAP